MEEAKVPTAPSMEKPAPRRVASMPISVPPVTLTPSPSPPSSAKKALIDPVYYRLVSNTLRQNMNNVHK